MKLLLLLAIAPLWAQEPALQVSAQKGFSFWYSDGSDVCYHQLYPVEKVFIAPGRQEECWRQVVQVHNETINNIHEHFYMDKAVQAIGGYLHKKFVWCPKIILEQSK